MSAVPDQAGQKSFDESRCGDGFEVTGLLLAMLWPCRVQSQPNRRTGALSFALVTTEVLHPGHERDNTGWNGRATAASSIAINIAVSM